jgi:glucose/mannose-6-phosphate isomerase
MTDGAGRGGPDVLDGSGGDLSGGALDDMSAIARTDRSGMLLQVAAIPAQIRDAWTRSRALDLPGRHGQATGVAVLGMGGSAIGGDLVRAIWSDRLRLPLEVVRGYELPAWVGPDTLVVASSYSGRTEETLAAVETAFVRRCPVAVITTGGPLGAVAAKASLPLLGFPGGGQPRAAVGHAVMLLAGLLERAGALELDAGEVEAGAAAAEAALTAWGPDIPTEANLAKQLAWSILDRLPVITGAGHLAAVARRWKTQLNENAKTMAVWDELPEADHNTIVGHPQPDATLDHQLHVLLASEQDHPRNVLRMELSGELLAESGISSQRVALPGATRLESALAGVVLGDLVSCYLAILVGRDPTPVDAIVRLKASMAPPIAETDEGGSDPSDGDSDLP